MDLGAGATLNRYNLSYISFMLGSSVFFSGTLGSYIHTYTYTEPPMTLLGLSQWESYGRFYDIQYH